MDQVQDQIDQKLKENNINVDGFMSNNIEPPSKPRGRPKRQRSVSIDKGGSKPKVDEVKIYDLNDPSPFKEDRHLLI